MHNPAIDRKNKVSYNDLSIRIIASLAAAHVVTEYGGNEPWLERLFRKSYYIEFGTTLLITFILVYYIYRCTMFLDLSFGWYEKPVKRSFLQLVFGVIFPTLAAFFLASIYFACFGVNILDTNYHIYALPFIALLITICNLYYLIRYLIAVGKKIDNESSDVSPENSSGAVSGESEISTREIFIVHTITKSFPVPTVEIAYFYRDSGHVFLRRFEGEDYLLSQSLEQIEKQLDSMMFFRVARYMIINRSAVVSFSPLTFGKIGVTLRPPYKEQVSASKPLAHNFRLWINRN